MSARRKSGYARRRPEIGAAELMTKPATDPMRDAPRYPDPADRLPAPALPAATPPAGPPGAVQTTLQRLADLLAQVLSVDAAVCSTPAADTAPWHAPALSDAVLQEVRFDAPRSGSRAAYGILAGRVQTLASGILLSEGARVSFSAYLNSFYEHYWALHAPVQNLTLRLFGSGEAAVELFRALPDGSAYCIGRQRLVLDPQHGATTTITLDPMPAGAGRIFFEITATSGVTLRAGRLETGTPTRQTVRLGIGLCTFNREVQLASNLRRLTQSAYWHWAKPRIVIVNQGHRFASTEMAALLAEISESTRVVEQANLGGAGGFTRAAMEIVQEGACSHVLFMDDDIEFDPAVLVTTHAFAARTTAPTVIGGAMVDLFRPTTMYEAGAVVDANNILRAALHNRPLDQPQLLNELAREVPCHFNGWWYCAIPAELFREYGLPLPIFIRGDDMEYGTRLMRRGVPTVSLPPVAVWHEPFYAKAPGWQLYYDLRNRLIFAACHRPFVRLDRSVVILRRLVDSLLKHDYQHAELVIRAIEDFLAGPAVLEAPMDTLHREIAALAAAHAPERPRSTVGMKAADWRAPPHGLWRRATLAIGMAALWLGLVRRRLRPDHFFIDQWHPWMTMHVSQYGLSDRMQSYVNIYRYDRVRLRGGLRRGLAAVWRYHREAGRAAGQWRAAHAELTSWPRWTRLLGLDRDSELTAPVTQEITEAVTGQARS
jgi:galactofuranosylgalactofuranosylrhamnosyl-N-acetylglucosaminyl-diphospho-decaprenol beta-1,5/1,6-galactofuranosyltransferase